MFLALTSYIYMCVSFICRIGWNNIAMPCNMQIIGMNYCSESNLSRPPSGRLHTYGAALERELTILFIHCIYIVTIRTIV